MTRLATTCRLDAYASEEFEELARTARAQAALRNGTLLMAYRGLEDRGMGMATSPAWNGPFRRLNGGAAVLGPASPAHTAVDEDPTMWLSPGGTVQMILHQEGVGGGPGLGTAYYRTLSLTSA